MLRKVRRRFPPRAWRPGPPALLGKDYWRRSAPDYEREGYHDVYVYSLPGDVKLSSLVADAREYAVTDVCGAIFEELNGAAVAADRHRNRV